MLQRLIELIALIIATLVFLNLGFFLMAGIAVGVLLSCIYHYLKHIFYCGNKDK